MKYHKFRIIPILLLIFFSLGNYLLTFGLILVKAQILEMISQVSQSAIEGFAALLLLYAGIHLISTLLSIAYNNGRNFFAVREFKRAWLNFSPRLITKKHAQKDGVFYNAVYNNFPRLYDLKISIYNQYWLIGAVIIIVIWKIYDNQFYIGAAFFPLILISSFFSAKFLAKKYTESIERISENKAGTIQWLNVFFRGFKELYLNQKLFSPQSGNNDWFRKRGEKVAGQLRTHSLIELKRSLFNMVFVGFPPLICVIAIFIFGLRQSLTIGDIFIWLMLVDYIVNASNSISSLKVTLYEAGKLEELIGNDLAWIMETEQKDLLTGVEIPEERKSKDFQFRLLDGHMVTFSEKPGFYQIRGSNGSGKTTLLESIAGINRDFDHWDREDIQYLQSRFAMKARIIEADPAIFPDIDLFWAQCLLNRWTPEGNWPEYFKRMCRSIISGELAEKWIEKVEALARLWDMRQGSLSKGEKVVFSFARVILSWDEEVKFLICDEAESALDSSTRDLFHATLKELSRRIAVYYISHVHWENRISQSTDSSFYTTIGLMGYRKTNARGIVIPIELVGRLKGSNKITGTGSLGMKLKDELNIALTAFIHSSPQYECLFNFDFHINSSPLDFEIGNTGSAGLALAAAILNIYRAFLGMETRCDIAATGHLKINGDVIPVSHQSEKTLAAVDTDWINIILTPDNVNRIRDLEEVLYHKANQGKLELMDCLTDT